MMTRREKLLMRPWQLRRYNNHKKKVVNAVPLIDFGPPAQRNHVTVKLKKLQKERERQSKIEEDNFKLLQNLGAIMTSKRVNDYWEKNPPNFLRRVCIYHRTRTPTPCLEVLVSPTSSPLVAPSTTRKSKCHACTPQPEKLIFIPEERVPWDPPKKVLTRRMTGSAVCPVMSDFDFRRAKNRKGLPSAVTETEKNEMEKRQKTEKKTIKANNKSAVSTFPVIREERGVPYLKNSEQSIVLSQGQIQVVVNFPSFEEVKVVRGKSDKYPGRNLHGFKTIAYGKTKPDKGR